MLCRPCFACLPETRSSLPGRHFFEGGTHGRHRHHTQWGMRRPQLLGSLAYVAPPGFRIGRIVGHVSRRMLRLVSEQTWGTLRVSVSFVRIRA